MDFVVFYVRNTVLFKKYINILLFRIWNSDTVTEWKNRAAKTSCLQMFSFGLTEAKDANKMKAYMIAFLKLSY